MFWTQLHALTLRVGTLPDNPPFSVLADGDNHFFGFEVDIVSEVCKRLQWTCHFIPLPLEQVFTQLEEGQINLAVASIIISPAREERFLFSLPYLASYAQFLVLKSSGSDVLEGRGRRIGLNRGSILGKVAKQLYPRAEIVPYETVADLMVALRSQDVDAIIASEKFSNYWAANNTIFKKFGQGIATGFGYGVMAHRGDEGLIVAFNQALKTMEADGSYVKIYQTYFSGVIEPIMMHPPKVLPS